MTDSKRREKLREAVRFLGLPEKERELALRGIDKLGDAEGAALLDDVAEIKKLLPAITKATDGTGSSVDSPLPVAGRRQMPLESPQDLGRKLVVGRGIALSGEITACDLLVIEGSVQANLANCRRVDIAVGGLFAGSAVVDEAEVRGRFEGTLTVRKRLLIRTTGRVVGSIRYGEIEIERGGEMSGDTQAHSIEETTAEGSYTGRYSNIVA